MFIANSCGLCNCIGLPFASKNGANSVDKRELGSWLLHSLQQKKKNRNRYFLPLVHLLHVSVAQFLSTVYVVKCADYTIPSTFSITSTPRQISKRTLKNGIFQLFPVAPSGPSEETGSFAAHWSCKREKKRHLELIFLAADTEKMCFCLLWLRNMMKSCVRIYECWVWGEFELSCCFQSAHSWASCVIWRYYGAFAVYIFPLTNCLVQAHRKKHRKTWK